jgi:hypothetical protein
MIILVILSAVILAVWNLVPRALDPLLSDRAGTIPAAWVGSGMAQYFAVVALLTAVVASPFVVAIAMALQAPPTSQACRRRVARWLGVALSLTLGLAVLNFPLDGMRTGWLLRDGSGVCFYHQYRLWPGAHITPCLELVTPEGTSRSYPISRNTLYQEPPYLRTDPEQTVVWFIDRPDARVRHGGVWCSMDRSTGGFIGAGGPYPATVTETAGFPP